MNRSYSSTPCTVQLLTSIVFLKYISVDKNIGFHTFSYSASVYNLLKFPQNPQNNVVWHNTSLTSIV